jgi:hypothetical protein
LIGIHVYLRFCEQDIQFRSDLIDGSTLAKGTLTELRLIDRSPRCLIDKSVDKFDSLNDFSQQVLAAG